MQHYSLLLDLSNELRSGFDDQVTNYFFILTSLIALNKRMALRRTLPSYDLVASTAPTYHKPNITSPITLKKIVCVSYVG